MIEFAEIIRRKMWDEIVGWDYYPNLLFIGGEKRIDCGIQPIYLFS